MNRNIPSYTVPEVMAVDWDGVIANEPQTAALIRDSARPFVSRAVYRQSETNDYRLHQALGRLPDDEGEAWYNGFMDTAADGRPFLYKDGSDFLTGLKETVTPHVIVTWSKHPVLALAKVAAAMRHTGGSVCVQIAASKFKGRHVAEWEQPRGKYSFMGVNAVGEPQAAFTGQSVRVIDNRARVFLGLPEKSGNGTWVRRLDDASAEQFAEQPHPEVVSQVATVFRLGEVALVPAVQPRTEMAGFYPVHPSGVTTRIPITGETTYADILQAVRK